MSILIGTPAARAVRIGFVSLLVLAGMSQAHAQEMKISGTGGGLAIVRLLADAFARTSPDASIVVLPSLGSGGGIKAVEAGAIQLAVSARDLTDAERLQGLKAMELARTPFVFAVSEKNRISGLTLAQLEDIYSGKTAQWPDGVKIRLVLRPADDADSEMVKSLSPAMRKAKLEAESRPGMLVAVTDQDTEESIERIPGTIGATSLGQLLAERRQIKALDLDGVRPSPKNLANGTYRYAKTLFLVMSPRTPAAAQRFLAFVRSPAGMELLGRTGYWVR